MKNFFLIFPRVYRRETRKCMKYPLPHSNMAITNKQLNSSLARSLPTQCTKLKLSSWNALCSRFHSLRSVRRVPKSFCLDCNVLCVSQRLLMTDGGGSHPLPSSHSMGENFLKEMPLWMNLYNHLQELVVEQSNVSLKAFLQVWKEYYFDQLMVDEQGLDCEGKESECIKSLFPQDIENVLTFVQLLCCGSQHVDELRRDLASDEIKKDLDGLFEPSFDAMMTATAKELEVVAHFCMLRLLPTAVALNSWGSLSFDQEATLTSSVSPPPLETIPAQHETYVFSPSARQKEKICGMRENASQAEMQVCELLIESVHLVLTNSGFGSSRHLRYELYPTLLAPLRVSEQLGSDALAKLSVCVAQCAEDCAVEEHCRKYRSLNTKPETLSSTSSGSEALSGANFLDRLRAPITTKKELQVLLSYLSSPSRVEGSGRTLWQEEEVRELRECCEGCPPRYSSTTTLSHLHVISRECQRRMKSVLDRYHTHVMRDGEKGTSGIGRAGMWSDNSESVRRLHQKKEIYEGKKALLPFAEWKKAEAENQRSSSGSSSARCRKTIKDYEREAEEKARKIAKEEKAPALEGAAGEANDGKEAHSRFTTEWEIQLCDASDMAEALASLHYRQPDFWHTLSRFMKFQIFLEMENREKSHLLDRYADSRNDESICSSNLAVLEELRNRDEFLEYARRICFALSFVQQTKEYESVMCELVAYGLLSTYIPPPQGGKSSSKIA